MTKLADVIDKAKLAKVLEEFNATQIGDTTDATVEADIIVKLYDEA